jgi:hypothetical protein
MYYCISSKRAETTLRHSATLPRHARNGFTKTFTISSTVLCAINSNHYKTNINQNTINEQRWTTMEINNWRSFVRLQKTRTFAFLTCSANVHRNSFGWFCWVGFTALQFSGNSIAISSIEILCNFVAHLWPLCGPSAFWTIVGPFWILCWASLSPSWVHFGFYFGPILGPFWVSFWIHSGPILGPYTMFLKPATKQIN